MLGRLPFFRNKNLSQSLLFFRYRKSSRKECHRAKPVGELFSLKTAHSRPGPGSTEPFLKHIYRSRGGEFESAPSCFLASDKGSREAQVLLRFFEVRLDAERFLIMGNGRIVFEVTAKNVRKLFVSDLKVRVH